MINRYFLMYIIVCFSLINYAQTTSFTIQPGGTGIDAAVSSGSATTNYGTSTTLSASRNASNVKIRGLFMFDFSAIPSNAIVTAAKLTLKGIAHTGSNAAYLKQITSSWNESTVTWSLMPNSSGAGQLSLAQSTAATQDYTLNVKAMVQNMVNVPVTNYGFILTKQIEVVTGGLVFASSDYSVAASRPKLELSWCLPMDVKASMTAATSSTSANGALNVMVTNGVPPYSYVWSDASTNKDLFNKTPGVYGLTVTDNVGNQTKKQFIIGAENTAMTFTLTPDGLEGKDAYISLNDNGSGGNINYKDQSFSAEKNNTVAWYSSRSLIEFDLSSLPSAAVVSSATLNLFSSGHNTTRSNAGCLYMNNSPWNESTVTWNNQPSHVTTGSLSIATTTSSSQNAILNVTNQVQGWVQNPSSNFGLKLMLADEVTANYAWLGYLSSDYSSLRPNLIITINIPSSTESSRNWEMQEAFDQNGAVISSTKIYFDDLGRTTQSLAKDANGDVFARQTIYDAYGRPSIHSLPAYVGNTLTYKTNFMLNTAATEYNYNNFDVTGKITTPDAIQTATINTLGYYYSDNNAIDTWQATATNPYTRTHYMADPYNNVKTTNGADNVFKAGTGRGVRNYSMVCGDELKFILGVGNSYKVKVSSSDPMTSTASTIASTSYIKATKSITTSPDNKEMVTYSIGDKIIATCMSGLPSPDNCMMTAARNYMDWYGTQSVDIHVPDSYKYSIMFPLPTYVFLMTTNTVADANISYVITDLNTETLLQSGVDYNIGSTSRQLIFTSGYLTANAGKPLFLRIRVVYTNAFISSLGSFTPVPAGIVQSWMDYGRWSVNYFDFAGNLRKTVSPKGINCISAGNITMATTYDYSHLGQLIATKSPDEGLKEITYNKNGQARFTQNSEQKLNKRFSYINLDMHGRGTEKGEFSNLAGSGTNGAYFQNYYGAYSPPFSNNISTATIINNADGLNDTYCNDVTYMSYEELSGANDVPAAYTYSASYLGKYKNGKVSKTWNANTSTWYKYDLTGRLFAIIKKVNDADYSTYAGSTANAQIKTYESNYDPYFGIPTNSFYQKNVAAEYAEHQFIFDPNKNLSATNLITGAGNSPNALNKLSYDKLGRLKRQVIGPDLQGIDYVYTINGALKAINHPSLDYTKDRGGDLKAYNDVNPGVKQDLYGEILEYYPNDYIRAGTSIETNTNGLYNGQIYGSRFKTRNDVNGTITGADYIDYLGANQVQLITTTNYGQKELANRYTYDNFAQLATSTFGTYTNTTNSFTARTDYKEFGASGNIAYDVNGNITGLKRNAYNVSGSAVLLDNLTYTISSTGNTHTQVADVASNSFPMSFNFKNQTGTPGTFVYNTNGQLTSSPDESVTAVSYYPNGQVKQVSFANGNTTTHYYDDQGKKYKSKYYSSGTASTKYNWFLFGAIYEYVTTTGSFNLKELSIGGIGRAGVYKQDVAGLNIVSGHAEYALTDHLGNVRVTFKKGAGNNLDVLSKADYYAFGGQLPGRLWQQSGGDYRYGYQGQEKSQDNSTWDNFELRNYNHDLGRWSAPDPYEQFNSPYLAMGNNPINGVDPDGGYWRSGAEGQADMQKFRNQLAEDKFLKRGRFSFEFLSKNYDEEVAELAAKCFGHGSLEYTLGGFYAGGGMWGTEDKFLQGLLEINNKYAGLGLSVDYLSSGANYLTLTAMTNNAEIYSQVLASTSIGQRSAEAAAAIPGRSGVSFDDAADAYSAGVYEKNHQEQLAAREAKNAMKEAAAAAKQSFEKEMDNLNYLYNQGNTGCSSAGGIYATSTGTIPSIFLNRNTRLKPSKAVYKAADNMFNFEKLTKGDIESMSKEEYEKQRDEKWKLLELDKTYMKLDDMPIDEELNFTPKEIPPPPYSDIVTR